MNKRKQRVNRIVISITLVITFLTIGFHPTGTALAYERVPEAGLAINGTMVDGIHPIRINGHYYLPFIHISKILGYNYIIFVDDTMTYETTDGSTTVRMTIGGAMAKRGDEYINIDAPRWINETAYISLGAAGALYNAFFYFKPENGSIQVEKPATRYRVQKGDSLWEIAEAHHTTVSALKSINNLHTNIIYRGDILKLTPKEQVKETEPIREKEPIKKRHTTTVAQVRTGIIEQAKKYIGAGYKFGATLDEAPNLFDCSSYTQLVFQENGIDIPRTSRQQASMGVSVLNFKVGDLIFFTDQDLYSDGRVGHVGIYMGNGDMIHASSSRGVHIAEDFMNIGYWQQNYLFAKRIIE
ncbi:C40 family peptidase [Alkalihalobacillus sp. BA299]|uniref:C40 family peptidase n=1 Tax=Alkalihalobacillus sp. BA299 TaxID=2815938 RepID=UPI001ADA5AEE|nr:C40 family peptidase [Alkalihalobacillus sp. BA299]